MTRIEFNQKYKDYIEVQGDIPFDGLCFDYETITDFLDDIFENVFTKIQGFQFSQIKLKFGYCRFYSNLSSVQMTNLIQDKINNYFKFENVK